MTWSMILNRDALNQLLADLAEEEGYRQFAYVDTVGKVTIGIGFNLTDVGLSHDESMVILQMRLEKIEAELIAAFPKYYELCPVRQEVLLDCAYNMGTHGLMEFKNMLTDILRRDFDSAADEMLQSEWAKEVGQRAINLAKRMRTGKHE